MAKKVNNTKRRLTFIDIIIVLALVGILGFVIYNVLKTDTSVSDDKAVQVEYQIKIEKVRYADFGIRLLEDNKLGSDFLLPSETVYLTKNSKEIGKILLVEYEPYMQSTGEVNESNELIYAELPGYINIIVTVEVNAEKTDHSYIASGEELLVGGEIEFRTQTYFGKGRIVGIAAKEEEKA